MNSAKIALLCLLALCILSLHLQIFGIVRLGQSKRPKQTLKNCFLTENDFFFCQKIMRNDESFSNINCSFSIISFLNEWKWKLACWFTEHKFAPLSEVLTEKRSKKCLLYESNFKVSKELITFFCVLSASFVLKFCKSSIS